MFIYLFYFLMCTNTMQERVDVRTASGQRVWESKTPPPVVALASNQSMAEKFAAIVRTHSLFAEGCLGKFSTFDKGVTGATFYKNGYRYFVPAQNKEDLEKIACSAIEELEKAYQAVTKKEDWMTIATPVFISKPSSSTEVEKASLGLGVINQNVSLRDFDQFKAKLFDDWKQQVESISPQQNMHLVINNYIATTPERREYLNKIRPEIVLACSSKHVQELELRDFQTLEEIQDDFGPLIGLETLRSVTICLKRKQETTKQAVLSLLDKFPEELEKIVFRNVKLDAEQAVRDLILSFRNKFNKLKLLGFYGCGHDISGVSDKNTDVYVTL